ncbi:2-hydroxyacyl-CoA dehydratase subunit D [Anaerotignum sp.]|uniref:2-hydroxyacyl-CoA dehydratase subunit D n=1 Tax=Anaerotignum sp. TaxID=2039241 RepID=UPI0003351B1C|nr:2-hydroxyacyl-CoA dehydratase family protein [Anaerotignum sp.]MCI7657367.1 2-hydroxyacyl-CoA dehydratase family protein [Clostridia bacterium]MDY5414463.1 2-hydroxyacyl-CoA dehydratase family protein [Anaerotignum sp.]CDC28614.1 lactoyl-CoA dehydratase subunit beta [Firmicutes bacterium CAG:466]CDD62600.1 lactoyl-CoA dehydratase subunit beta [Clostridium sp. CAG:505]
MSKVEAILSQLKDIAANPKKAMDDYKAETGKGAVGIMPIYAPEEMVHATGYLPMGIWGAQGKTISKARTYLPPFACSIMQQVMELQCEGAYDDLAAVLFSVPCDTLKCLSQKWKGTSPVIVFTHPQNRGLEAANTFLVKEYELVKAQLEHYLGVTITNAALERSIAIYNENRQVMREFVKVAAEYPQVIDAVSRHAVFKARQFMLKEKHTELVKELIAEVKAMPVQPWTGKKVVVAGILLEPNELLDIFNEFGLAIVDDDLAQESRQIRVDVLDGEEGPLYRMAKAWQQMYGCSVATDTKKGRGKMLMNKMAQTGADAVIIAQMKFCDPEEWDYPVMYREFEERGVKNLMIEVDQEVTSFEQVKTRLQSFVEMM